MFARGFLGVDMFFVISGFLIVTLLLRERDRNGEISLRRFYARRTLRIFPIYYAILFALIAVMWIFKAGTAMASTFFGELVFLLTYTSNWVDIAAPFLGITWSLATEEQFYLLWPPAEKLLKKWWLPFIVAFIAVNQLVNFQIISHGLETLVGLRWADLEILQCTFTPICFGVILAHLLHSERGYGLAARLLGRRWMPLLLTGVLLLVVNLPMEDIAGWPRLLTQITMVLLVCSCVVREDHLLRPALRLYFVQRIGVVSYGMYLLHLFVRHPAAAIADRLPFDSHFSLFLLCLVSTYIVSEASFRWFEKPFLKLKHRFSTAAVPAHTP
jgi:peptidoglycan/LPS O-acetylase OafA/YrhL